MADYDDQRPPNPAPPTGLVIALDIHGLVTLRVCGGSTDIGPLSAFASDGDRPPDITFGPGPEVDWRGVSLPAAVLRPAVHAAALGNGGFPLHAAAFVVDDAGIAVVGWPRSGKTGVLLEFLRRRNQIVAAEWSFVTAGRLLPIPDAVRIRGYDTPGQRAPGRLRARVLADLAARMSRWPGVVRRLDEARAVDVDPTTWGPVAPGPVALDVIAFLVPDADGPVRMLAADDASARLAAYLRHDLAPLGAAYNEFVFRCGRRDHAILDHLDELIDRRAKEAVQPARSLLIPTTRPPDPADVFARLSAAL